MCNGSIPISGKNVINYKTVRTNRRTIAIYVKNDGSVELRCNKNTPITKIQEFVANKTLWIENTRLKIQSRGEKEDKIILSKADQLDYFELAKIELPKQVDYYANIMELNPQNVKINGAKTRWGSCSGKNNLNFSWMLMLAENSCVDYVVVHELSHIIEHNHSPKFWAVVEKIIPNYRAENQKLKLLCKRFDFENWER